jgi:hypothetical protein
MSKIEFGQLNHETHSEENYFLCDLAKFCHFKDPDFLTARQFFLVFFLGGGIKALSKNSGPLFL